MLSVQVLGGRYYVFLLSYPVNHIVTSQISHMILWGWDPKLGSN